MRVLLLYLLAIVGLAFAKLPSYIKPCCKNAATVNKYFVDSANKAIKYLKNGDENLQISSTYPYLKHPGAKYQPNKYFYLELFETQVYGLDTMEIVEAKCDFDKKQIWFKFENGQVKLFGKYLAKSLRADDAVRGKAIIYIAKNTYEMNMTYAVDSNNRMSIERLTSDFVGKSKFSYQLENLDQHEALNDLWKKTQTGFANFCMVTYAELVKTIWQQVCNAVTFDELFPEKCSS